MFSQKPGQLYDAVLHLIFSIIARTVFLESGQKQPEQTAYEQNQTDATIEKHLPPEQAILVGNLLLTGFQNDFLQLRCSQPWLVFLPPDLRQAQLRILHPLPTSVPQLPVLLVPAKHVIDTS